MTAQPTESSTPPRRFPANADEYVLGGAQWFSDTLRTLSEEIHPILKSFPRQTVSEFPDLDEDSTSTDYRQFRYRHEVNLLPDVALGFDVEEFRREIRDLADRRGRRSAQDMLRFISDSADVVQMDLSNPTEYYIQALPGMAIEFDAQGNNNLSFIMTADFVNALKENPPTAEQIRRIDKIMAAKREEYRASRGRRRLS